jgi:perosamine synthetase
VNHVARGTVRNVAAQRYDFSPDDIAWVQDQIGNLLHGAHYLTMGQFCEQFEHEFASAHDVTSGVSVNSGTGALEVALRSVDVAGGEVVVPTNTFAATVYAVLRAGAVPVFAECGPDMSVAADDVHRLVTRRTRAVVAVHIGGTISASFPGLARWCADHDVPLVEDAAHAHGSTVEGCHAGAYSTAAAFSFFPTKVMTTAEGGMIITNDTSLAERARELRDQGKIGGRNFHKHEAYNWRMTEIAAILGLRQLRRLPEFVLRRREIAAIFNSVFNDVAGIEIVSRSAGSNFYKYILLADGVDAAAVTAIMAERGVEMSGRVYEIPCHMQPAFRRYATRQLPTAERMCAMHLCPPIYPSLSNADAMFVAETLADVLGCLQR